MNVLKIAAFSTKNIGGNPAGVSITDQLPSEQEMARIAAAIGFSETVFAAPLPDKKWRVRYFSPESEVPFCGHATIALGAALALKYGDGIFSLELNNAQITVDGHKDGDLVAATLQSPPTHSKPASKDIVQEALDLFGWTELELNQALPPALIHGGADHLLLALNSRERLADMQYDLDSGRKLMQKAGIVTIILVFVDSEQLFHTRNPFASGGVYEDPATGAATAALAGYLRDIGWPHGGLINVVQGEDMGSPSRLRAEFSDVKGSSIRVSGHARVMV